MSMQTQPSPKIRIDPVDKKYNLFKQLDLQKSTLNYQLKVLKSLNKIIRRKPQVREQWPQREPY